MSWRKRYGQTSYGRSLLVLDMKKALSKMTIGVIDSKPQDMKTSKNLLKR
jgi:hypothetical protein